MVRVKDTFKSLFTLQGLKLLLVAALLLEATSLIQFFFAKKGLQEEANRRAESELVINRLEVEKVTNTVEQAARDIAWVLKDKLASPETFEASLKQMLDTNPVIIDAALAFTPEFYPKYGHWYEPLLARRTDGSYEPMVLGSADHDYFKTDWYDHAVNRGEDYWSEPYYDESGGRTMLVTFATPLRDPEGRIVGLVGADISLAWLTEMIVGIQLYPDSFSTLTSREGQMMACPAETLAVAKAIRYDTLMEKTGWKMSIVIPEDEIYSNAKRVGFIVLLLQIVGLFLLGLILQRTARNLRKLKAVSDSKDKIENELRIASAIQMAMLPKIFPPYPDRTDFDIFGTLMPAKEVGGDLFDYYIRDDRLFFCIGDVSGKGIPASLVMAVTRSLFRNVSGHESNPARILSQMNESMSQDNESNMFVTFFIGALDLSTGQLRYCNAGHNAPLLLTEEGVSKIDVKPNCPIGIDEQMRYPQQELMIPSGATLFLYTDGLTEAENARKELFGEKRLLATAGSIAREPAREQVAIINEAVHNFVGAAPQSDDLTMLSIKFLGDPESITDRHLLLQNDIQQIPQLADFIETIAEESGISQALAMSLNLALEEAVTNVILYAYPEGMEGLVDIEAIIRKHQICFNITDSGQPFDPTQVAEVDTTLPLEERPIGGLGIHIVRNIMDEVSYKREDGHNFLRLIKNL